MRARVVAIGILAAVLLSACGSTPPHTPSSSVSAYFLWKTELLPPGYALPGVSKGQLHACQELYWATIGFAPSNYRFPPGVYPKPSARYKAFKRAANVLLGPLEQVLGGVHNQRSWPPLAIKRYASACKAMHLSG